MTCDFAILTCGMVGSESGLNRLGWKFWQLSLFITTKLSMQRSFSFLMYA